MVARLPVILGHEPAGEVVEVGAHVTNFKVGDRVALDPFGHCGRCGPCRAGRFQSLLRAHHALGRIRRIHGRAGRQRASRSLDDEHRTGRAARTVRHRPARGRTIVSQGRRQRRRRRTRTDRAEHRAGGARARRHLDSDDRAGEWTPIVSRSRAPWDFRTVSTGDRDWIEQARAMLPSDGADVVFDAAGAIDSPRELLRRGRSAGGSRMARARSQVGRIALAVFPWRKRSSTRVSALRKPGVARSRWSRAAPSTCVRWSPIAILFRTASKRLICCASAVEQRH